MHSQKKLRSVIRSLPGYSLDRSLLADHGPSSLLDWLFYCQKGPASAELSSCPTQLSSRAGQSSKNKGKNVDSDKVLQIGNNISEEEMSLFIMENPITSRSYVHQPHLHLEMTHYSFPFCSRKKESTIFGLTYLQLTLNNKQQETTSIKRA